MRSFLASSIGVAAVAALTLPSVATAATTTASAPAAAAEPAGSTQSLPLAPLPGANRVAGGSSQEGLAAREVRPFSLVGVVWDNARDELRGSVQVRTRARVSGAWSAWQDLETHNQDHGADPGTPEAARPLRGSTAPLWVGDSDAVEARVDAEPAGDGQDAAPLPGGLRLDLVDPGPGPPRGTRARTPAAVETPDVLPALDEAATRAEAAEVTGAGIESADVAGADSLARPIGPRPRIITRRGWGRRRAAARARLRLHQVRQGRLRPPHRDRQRIQLRPVGLRAARHLPLPRQEQRLAGHRLQLRGRQVRKHLRGARRGRGEGRDGGAHARVQHQQHGHRGPRHLQQDQPVGCRTQGRRTARGLEARSVRAEPQGQEHAGLGWRQPLQEGPQRQLQRHRRSPRRIRHRLPGGAPVRQARHRPGRRRPLPGPALTGREGARGVCINWPAGSSAERATESEGRPQQEAETTGDRSDPPGRRQGHQAAPAHGAHAQADGSGGGCPLPHPPAGPGPGGRGRPHRPGHLLPGRGVRAVLR